MFAQFHQRSPINHQFRIDASVISLESTTSEVEVVETIDWTKNLTAALICVFILSCHKSGPLDGSALLLPMRHGAGNGRIAPASARRRSNCGRGSFDGQIA